MQQETNIPENENMEQPVNDTCAEMEENNEATDNEATKETANEADENSPEALQAKIDDLQDKYLRKVAEFENFRRRTLKEKTELILNGGEKILTALLPILDDMERAENSIRTSSDVEALAEGVALIFQKLRNTLEGQGLHAIDTTDKDFDTDFHEAIAMIPAASDEQKGKVIDCVQKGYMLNEKVIRHAKVAIGQ